VGSASRRTIRARRSTRTTQMHRVGGSLVRPSRSTSAEAAASRSGHRPQALRARCMAESRDRVGSRQAAIRQECRSLRSFAEFHDGVSRAARVEVTDMPAPIRDGTRARARRGASRRRSPVGARTAPRPGERRIRLRQRSLRARMDAQERTEPVASSSGSPTDLRRSGDLSELHGLRSLRARCYCESRRPADGRQEYETREKPLFASFPTQTAEFADAPRCSTQVGPAIRRAGAGSSTRPADLPLPRPATRCGFFLSAPPARRSGNLRLQPRPGKGAAARKPRKLRGSAP
jgi:hypothetical protein